MKHYLGEHAFSSTASSDLLASLMPHMPSTVPPFSLLPWLHQAGIQVLLVMDPEGNGSQVGEQMLPHNGVKIPSSAHCAVVEKEDCNLKMYINTI